MFRLVIAGKRSVQRLSVCLAAYVAQRDPYLRIPFTGNNGADDLHAGGAGDIADDVVQLQIHEGECLVHVLDVRGGIVQMPLSGTQVDSQRRNLTPRTKAHA